MNLKIKKFLGAVVLFSAPALWAQSTSCPTNLVCCANFANGFSPRSQSVNAARDLVGWQTHINRWDMDSFYGSLSVTPEYTQTYRTKRLAQCLFGSENVVFSGSRRTDRKECEILADYFCLPMDFKSTLQIQPRIRNFLVDFDLFLGLDNWVEGLWFRLQTPIVYTNWDLRLIIFVLVRQEHLFST